MFLFLIFILMGMASLALITFNKSSKPMQALKNSHTSSKFEMTDELIIRLAKRLGGRITATDLAAQTSFTVEQAKVRLESLQQKGICDIDLENMGIDGKIYFQFDV